MFPKCSGQIKKKWIKKAGKSSWTIWLVFMFPFRVMVLEWSKVVSFSQFFACFNKTSKAVIANSFRSFRKWYWLLYSDLRFRKH